MDGVNLDTLLLWSDTEGHEIRIETLLIAARSANVGDLLNAHWQEVANYKDKVPLAPRWESYETFERDGNLLLLTVRENEELIGYGLFIKRLHLNYESLLVGENNLIFLREDKRQSRLGSRLIDLSEAALKVAGVNKITFHVKPEHDFGPVLKRKGYTLEEHIWGKLL